MNRFRFDDFSTRRDMIVGIMRPLPLLLASALSLSGCDQRPPAPANASGGPYPIDFPSPASPGPERRSSLGAIDTIEVTGGARHVRVNRDDSAISYFPGRPDEAFTAPRGTFRRLEARLLKYRREATAYGDPDSPDIVMTSCMRDAVNGSGAGRITFRWTGDGVEDVYSVDSECGASDAVRDRALRAIIAGLPMPGPR